MSLLLDALKKAAQQKAEKNREEASASGRSDETQLDGAADGDTATGAHDDSIPRAAGRAGEDETELDHSQLEARLERAQAQQPVRDPGDDTGLDIPDQTETEAAALGSEQMQTGEDETIIFADEDVSEFMGEPEYVSRETRAPEDETDLSQRVDQNDLTDVRVPVESGVDVDETDLSELAHREDETEFQAPAASADETDLGEVAQRADETDLERAAPPTDETDLSRVSVPADETDVSQAAIPADDTDLSQVAVPADETDLSQIAAPAEETDLSQAPAAEDVTDISHPSIRPGAPIMDEDQSLDLADQTGMTSPTSLTDPQVPQDQAAALQSGDVDIDELALVDTTRHSPPPEQTTTSTTSPTASSAATRVRQDTITSTTESTTRRADATGTMTYAPDNYDRTLMKLPNDDASKLFAGMKSDSDVVMTPDYAKKVFRSKSSALRWQNTRVYTGVLAVIVGLLLFYAVFEFQQESDSIEASLDPLKRDPMPGTIRPQQQAEESLFAQTDAEPVVDQRTLELLESAETLEGEIGTAEPEVESETAAISEPVEAPIETTEAAEVDAGATGSVSGSATESVASVSEPAADAATPSTAASQDETAGATADTAAAEPAGQSSSLEISSSKRIGEKDILLRQAYTAYQRGDDDLALELYNKVLAIEPTNRNALLARAAIHVHNNNAAAAVEDYQQLLLINPKDSLAMTSLITVANFSPLEAESRLKLMIREEPNSPYLNFALANAYGAQNRWQEAQGHYFKALENNPGDPNYAYNLAVSLEHIAKPKVAIAYYQRALENMSNGLATFSKEVVDQRLEMLSKL